METGKSSTQYFKRLVGSAHNESKVKSFKFKGRRYHLLEGGDYFDIMKDMAASKLTPCSTADVIYFVLNGPKKNVLEVFGGLHGIDTVDGAAYSNESGKSKFKVFPNSPFLIDPEDKREVRDQGDTLISLTEDEYNSIPGRQIPNSDLSKGFLDKKTLRFSPGSVEGRVWTGLIGSKLRMSSLVKKVMAYKREVDAKNGEIEEDNNSENFVEEQLKKGNNRVYSLLEVNLKKHHRRDSTTLGAFYIGSFVDGFGLDAMRVSRQARVLGYKKA